jgi:hypothetical protein
MTYRLVAFTSVTKMLEFLDEKEKEEDGDMIPISFTFNDKTNRYHLLFKESTKT